jgi:polyisoprenoid-binding protein YceI
MSAARILLATLALGAGLAQAAPQTYKIDTRHSRVTFYVNHLGYSNSVAELKLADANLSFDNDDWSKAKVDATIPVSSLNLGDPEWSNEIAQSDKFLDDGKFPNIAFTSTRLEKTDATHGKLYGNLTVHGVTKAVVLDLRLNKIGDHPMRKTSAVGFTATVTLKRSDFGVTTYLPIVGDELDVRIEIEAYVPPPAKG